MSRQETAVVAKPVKEHPIAKKMGDFFIDVAKLVIGGVILAGLMKQDIDYSFLFLVKHWSSISSGYFRYVFN